jgi:hypothetical protein
VDPNPALLSLGSGGSRCARIHGTDVSPAAAPSPGSFSGSGHLLSSAGSFVYLGGGGCTDSRGKHSLVIDVALHPGHQMLDILGRRHLCRPLVLSAVLPEILELVCGFHFRASGRRAELGDGAVLISRISLLPQLSLGCTCVPAGLSGCRNRPLPNTAQPVSFQNCAR